MPVVKIEMWEGRPKETRKSLISEITETICRVLKCPKEAVTVIISEIKKENWGISGKPSDEE